LLRKALGMDWEQFNGLVERYGLITFLFKNHELLQYYDNGYIVDDTLRYIRQQGGNRAVDCLEYLETKHVHVG
jgi:hypothetical protein